MTLKKSITANKLLRNTVLFCAAAAALSPLSAAEVAGKKMVWAHNTPWFRPEDNSLYTSSHFNYPLQEVANTPTMRHDSLQEEIRIAMEAGIDGFFLDLGTDPNLGPFHWSMIVKDYLKAAEGTDFQIGICLDGGNRGVDYEVREVVRMLNENGSHPNYPTYEGRNILFTYVYNQPGTWEAEEWKAVRKGWEEAGLKTYLVANLAPWPNRSIDLTKETKYLDTFDAVYMFDSPAHANDPVSMNNHIYKEFCDKNGKQYIPTLHAGYIGAWLIGNDFYNPFRGGDFLYSTWQAAKEIPSDWYHVTTWNDQMETAMFRQAYTFGLVDSIRWYNYDLKGIPFKYDEPKVLMAYHREEIPGTLLRLEALNFPSVSGEDVVISGRLLDCNGNEVAVLEEKIMANGSEPSRTEWLIPTADLAYSPFLIPEMSVTCGDWQTTVKTPAVLLVSSWQQNSLTLNIPLDVMRDFDNTLDISQSGQVLTANVSFDAPEPVKRITLFKNDRAIAVFQPGVTKDECIFNFNMAGDMDIKVVGGRVINGLKKGAQFKGCGNFDYTNDTITNIYNSGTLAMSTAGSPDMALEITMKNGGKTYTVTAADLVEKRRIEGEGYAFSHGTDGTLLLSEPLNIASGDLSISVFAPEPRPADSYYVRYDTMDDNVLFSAPVFPFGENVTVERAILETPVTMETRVWNMRDIPEFLTPAAEVPVQENTIVNVPVSVLTNRTAYWNFDGNGLDTGSEYYCNPVAVPEGCLVDGGFDGSGQAVSFDGKTQFLLRRCAWPIGGSGTISFWLNPDEFTGKKQSVIFKAGWQDGLSVNLTGDGCVEIVRNYADGMTERILSENMTGNTPLEPGKWHFIEIKGDAAGITLFVDGAEDAFMLATPVRRYGPGTVYLGGGMPGYEKYSGKLDDLFVSGL